MPAGAAAEARRPGYGFALDDRQPALGLILQGGIQRQMPLGIGTDAVSPQAGQSANLDSITAVVIGGTSLFGGRGAIVGTLVGALVVGVFRNGLALAGVDVLWQEFAIGLLIIIAVATDQWIRRV